VSQYYVSPENHNENQQHSDILVGGMPNFLQGLCHWFGAVTFLSGQLLLRNLTVRLVLVLGLHSLAIDSSCSKTLMSFECFLFFSFLFIFWYLMNLQLNINMPGFFLSSQLGRHLLLLLQLYLEVPPWYLDW
jgi:hypothetical protein